AGTVVVLDAGDHRVRAAGLVLVPGLVVGARSGRLGMAVAMGLAGDIFPGRRDRGRGSDPLRLGARGFVLDALARGGFLGATLVGFGQALLFRQVALARFLELAQDLGALVVLRLASGGGRRLVPGAVDRLHQGDL